MPVRFGEVYNELGEEGEGRRWNYHGPEWVSKEGKKHGFVSTNAHGQYPVRGQTSVGETVHESGG